MLVAAGLKLGGDGAGLAADGFDDSPLERREVGWTVREDEDGLASITPRAAKRENDVEGAAADEHDIDAGEELAEAVRTLIGGVEEVEAVVGPGKKAVNADTAKDGELHSGSSQVGFGVGS